MVVAVTTKVTIADCCCCLYLGTPQRRRIAHHHQLVSHFWRREYSAEELSARSAYPTIKANFTTSMGLNSVATELISIVAKVWEVLQGLEAPPLLLLHHLPFRY